MRRRTRLLRGLVAAVVVAAGSYTAAVTIPAGAAAVAFEHPRPHMTVVDAGFEPARCAPLCPPPRSQPQWITAKWTDEWQDELTYSLQVRQGPNGGWSTVYSSPRDHRTPPNGTGSVYTYTAHNLAIGQAHCLRVRAETASGIVEYSPMRCAAAAPPTAPRNFAIHRMGSVKAVLVFNESTGFGAGAGADYNIYVRRTDQTAWTLHPSMDYDPVAAPDRLYRVDGLASRTDYCFKVTAVHALSETPLSGAPEICGTTNALVTTGWSPGAVSYRLQQPWNLSPNERFRYMSTRRRAEPCRSPKTSS